MLEKFKSLLQNDHLFYGVLVVAFGVCSFFLGQQSVSKASSPLTAVSVVEPVVVEKEVFVATSQFTNEATTTASDTKMTLVGSKKGTKYHLPTCPGAKQIKAENLVTFDSIQAAQAAGYTRAGNCPAL